MAREFAKKFYKSEAWKITREVALKRDKYLCVRCGCPAEEVHHIIHLTASNISDVSIALNVDNLESLCGNCHRAEHEKDRHKGADYDAEQYCFDEYGFLIRKQLPPGEK